MTRLERIAIAAMKGRIASTDWNKPWEDIDEDDPSRTEGIAAWSINMAKELIQQLDYIEKADDDIPF